MPKNVIKFGEPRDRLSRIGETMLDALEGHAENPDDDVKAIVLLDDMEMKQGCGALRGYGDDDDWTLVLARLLEHAQAIARSAGMDLDVITAPIRNQG